MDYLMLGKQGIVLKSRIVAVGIAEAAAMRRVTATTPHANLIDLTYGERRRTVIILDSGHVVLSPLTLAKTMEQMAYE